MNPFATIDTYGPDATRWYMITNAEPWDNLKFNLEVFWKYSVKFFGTLFNTYNFLHSMQIWTITGVEQFNRVPH
ncbi:MAG: hypothetical protein R2822_16965 [Spirosomataceae bacterium]